MNDYMDLRLMLAISNEQEACAIQAAFQHFMPMKQNKHGGFSACGEVLGTWPSQSEELRRQAIELERIEQIEENFYNAIKLIEARIESHSDKNQASL